MPAANRTQRRAQAQTDIGHRTGNAAMSTQLSTQPAILRQRLNESQPVQHWRPEPGDTLLRTLRGLKPAQGPFGQGHMLIIETGDGTLWSMWLTAYLKAELEAQGARPGRWSVSSTWAREPPREATRPTTAMKSLHKTRSRWSTPPSLSRRGKIRRPRQTASAFPLLPEDELAESTQRQVNHESA